MQAKRKSKARIVEEKGIPIKIQNFDTDRGRYTLIFVSYRQKIYYLKYLNGELKECVKLEGKNDENQNLAT